MNISVPGTTPERTNDVYSTVLERVRASPRHSSGRRGRQPV
jgi:hypothetical protein